MLLRIASVLILLALPMLHAAADGDAPVVAMLRYGGEPDETTWSEHGVLDMLQAEGYISAEERDGLDLRNDLEGENITIFWGDAGWDLATANLMIDDALGRAATALVTVTTPVTRAAVNATADMDDDAPVVLFASVFSPVESGIFTTACEKPANATGSVIHAPYARALSLLQAQDSDIGSIGVIHSSTEISGIAGAEEISALADDMGLAVEVAAVNAIGDFPAATASLTGKGVDAIVAPIDALTAQALPVVSKVANENGIPFLYPVLGAVYHGATFGVGFLDHYAQGIHLGRLLTRHLAGELDPAATAARVFTGESHSVNLDAAEEQGIDISQALIDSAEIVIQDGVASQSDAFQAAYATLDIAGLRSGEARDAADAIFESLICE